MSEHADSLDAAGTAETVSGDQEAPDRASGDGAAGETARARPTIGSANLRLVGVMVVIAVLLALATIVTFVHLPRYQLPGEPALPNTDFAGGFADWDIDGLISLDETEMGLVVLQNRDPEKLVHLRQTLYLPPGRTAVRLAADLATSRVQQGEESWQAARIYLVQQGPDGDHLWNQPHELINLVGTTSRQHFERIFEIPGSIERALLGVELAFATGRFEIGALTVETVEERPVFRLAASLIVGGWSLLIFWVVLGVHGAIRSPTVRGWLVGTAVLLMIGVFMPSVLRQQLLDGLASGFGLRFSDPDAFGHGVVYALLAFLVRIGRHRDPLLLHLSCWWLVGAVTEVLQLMTADRDPEAADWLADAFGVMLGLALAEGFLRLKRWIEPPKARHRQHG
jgi:hypothetical protein